MATKSKKYVWNMVERRADLDRTFQFLSGDSTLYFAMSQRSSLIYRVQRRNFERRETHRGELNPQLPLDQQVFGKAPLWEDLLCYFNIYTWRQRDSSALTSEFSSAQVQALEEWLQTRVGKGK